MPQHVLRFWETKFAQIRPLKRGGGRRYYRPEDIDLLRAIRGLLYDKGYTIKGVQKLIREGGLKLADGEVVPDVPGALEGEEAASTAESGDRARSAAVPRQPERRAGAGRQSGARRAVRPARPPAPGPGRLQEGRPELGRRR